MQFFSDLVSALNRLAGDDVNIGAELESIKAAEAAFEANVNAQVTAAINAQLATLGFNQQAFATAQTQIADLETRVAAIENDETTNDPSVPKAPAALVISTTSLADAVVGTAYTGAVATTGGTGTVTVEVTGLPAGLAADTSGNITGTATGAPGPSSLSVTATDEAVPPVVVTASLTLTVDAAPAA